MASTLDNESLECSSDALDATWANSSFASLSKNWMSSLANAAIMTPLGNTISLETNRLT